MSVPELEMTPELSASIDALVAAAPPLPLESQRIVADILGPAFAGVLARRAAEQAAALNPRTNSEAA